MQQDNPNNGSIIQEEIRAIKKSLRLSMNGVVSTLQRRQGLDYKINFGVEIPRLKDIAARHAPDRELANTLWHENIRECRMLAIFLMPGEEYPAVAEKWIAEARFTEIADHLAMNILCKLPDAAASAMEWAGKDDTMFRYCGYLTLSHLFRKGTRLCANDERKLFNIISRLFDESNRGIEHRCAQNALIHYVESECENGRDITDIIDCAPDSLRATLRECFIRA